MSAGKESIFFAPAGAIQRRQDWQAEPNGTGSKSRNERAKSKDEAITKKNPGYYSSRQYSGVRIQSGLRIGL
jgi:hypothetical protein